MSRVNRSAFNSWFTSLASGIASGVLFQLALLVLSVLQYQGFEYMGVQDSDTQSRAMRMFGDTITLEGLRILGALLATGLVTGVLAGIWTALLSRLLEWQFGWLRSALFSLLGLLVLHLSLLAWAMGVAPQPFVDAFHNGGAVPSFVQRVASEWLPPWVSALPAWGLLWSFPAFLLLLSLRRTTLRRTYAVALGLSFLAAALLTSVMLLSRSDERRFPAPQQASVAVPHKNVLILAADSLRPDKLSALRGEGLKRMAREGVVYSRAFTVLPRTFPSWMTFLTGQYPASHGIRDMFPSPEMLSRPFNGLPRILAGEGYATGVFSDFAGDIFSRVDLGFQRVEVPEFSIRSNIRMGLWKLHVHLLPYLMATGQTRRMATFFAYERLPDAPALTERFMKWRSSLEPGKPFLGVLFYSTSHFPYCAPYPFYRDRLVAGYEGPHRFCKVGLGLENITEGDKAQVRELFLAGMEAVDAEVSRVLDWLQATGELDSTIIVVLSDHGEGLYDEDRGNSHGEMLSGMESLQFPYLWRIPGMTARVVDQAVSNITLTPTLLGLLGFPVPTTMEGANLAASADMVPPQHEVIHAETGLLFVDPDTDYLKGRSIRFARMTGMFDVDPNNSELYLSGNYRQDSMVAKHRMALDWPTKVLYIPTRQGVRFECYNLEADPLERTNLWDRQTPDCLRLKEAIYAFATLGGSKVKGDYILP